MQAGDNFPFLTRTGLAQALRQSAWHHALAGLPEQTVWPWTDASDTAAPELQQLGLSAAVAKDSLAESSLEAEPTPVERARSSRKELSQVSVGDRITITAANESSRVYRVTGRRVVDPHLAEDESARKPLDTDATLVSCLPLDPALANTLRLVIEATRLEQQPSPAHGPQQRL
jgi:hypothetical protein